MRSDHLSKHIRTHLGKKSAVSASGSVVVQGSTTAQVLVAPTESLVEATSTSDGDILAAAGMVTLSHFKQELDNAPGAGVV